MKKVNLPKLLEVVSRWYVFIFLNFYGLGKIAGMQFYRRGELPAEVAKLTLAEAGRFDIAWTFMGYSFFYILFVGVSQIIGAWLLLWNKTKLLGVAILIPIMLNIIVFDIIFLPTQGALVNANIYFFMLIYILYFNKKQVIEAWENLTAFSKDDFFQSEGRWRNLLLVIITMALIFGVDQFFVTIIGH